MKQVTEVLIAFGSGAGTGVFLAALVAIVYLGRKFPK